MPRAVPSKPLVLLNTALRVAWCGVGVLALAHGLGEVGGEFDGEIVGAVGDAFAGVVGG